MRAIAVIMGFALTQTNEANHVTYAKDPMDNLVDKIMDKLFDHALMRPPSQSRFTIPTSPSNSLSRRVAPTRSVQAFAEMPDMARREALLMGGMALAGLASQARPASALTGDTGAFSSEKAKQLLAVLSGNAGSTAPEEIRGSGQLMSQKEHGTCVEPVQKSLRWSADRRTAEQIDCFNRDYAEYFGYFQKTGFLSAEDGAGENGKPPVTFYDSVTGKPLFVAPKGRSWESFVAESKFHGWPSFRDTEVVRENVRVLPNGETVSVDGTHLGHNLPDGTGNRYCINLVSVAGKPFDAARSS